MPLAAAIILATAAGAGISLSEQQQESKRVKSLQDTLGRMNQVGTGDLTQENINDISRRRLLRQSIYMSQGTQTLGNVGRTQLV